jgi:MinD-like ATPase involved in chromosome partitioning or flagellar assembly
MGTENLVRRYAAVSGKGGVGKTILTANLAASLVWSQKDFADRQSGQP